MDSQGYELRRIERCASTNGVLLAEKGLARPVLLLADVQTAGRGRRGRRWHSAPGAGLTFSPPVALRRPFPGPAALPPVARAAGPRAPPSPGVPPPALKGPDDPPVVAP